MGKKKNRNKNKSVTTEGEIQNDFDPLKNDDNDNNISNDNNNNNNCNDGGGGGEAKINKHVRSFKDFESLKWSNDGLNKLTVIDDVDPVKLREMLEKKTKKKVDLISPQPKKDKDKDAVDKKKEGENKPEILSEEKEHLLIHERVMDGKFLKDARLFSSFKFTSKQNACVGPDDWKYNKAEGSEDGSSPIIVEPRNKMSDVFVPPTNRAPCNATVLREDFRYRREDLYDCLERRWNSSGEKAVVLATTSTWDNLGLTVELQQQNVQEHTNMIIGIVDTGIYPEAPSFSPNEYRPLQRGLIGSNDPNFQCNNKIVGAQICYDSQNMDERTIRDSSGHGTNMAFAAAGNFVQASIGKLKTGIGRGGVPAARIAVYKISLDRGEEKNRYQAICRAAQVDNVDVLSISWGTKLTEGLPKIFRYFDDEVGAGTFVGILKGILACVAVGNNCQYVYNSGPWNLAVGACNAPTLFTTEIQLGNLTSLLGYSMNGFEETELCSLTWFEEALTSKVCDTATVMYRFFPESPPLILDSEKVEGTIVVGYTVGNDVNQAVNIQLLAKEAGAVGVILITVGVGCPELIPFHLPGAWMSYEDGKKIMEYAKSLSPIAKILPSIEKNNPEYPAPAHFSPKGPNPFADFTKPDICAVGEHILVTGHKAGEYSFDSGTSVATASVSGVVAFMKSKHPDWSPSAIKSALMTTAKPMNVRTVDEIQKVGSGLIDPLKALEPGLLYDLTDLDYILFMKGKQGDHLLSNLGVFQFGLPIPTEEFNYPSFRGALQGSNRNIVFRRRVKHVGLMEFSTYAADISTDNHLLEVSVDPFMLSFDRCNEEKSFTVTIKVKEWNIDGVLSATLLWRNARYTVRSPIIVVRIVESLFCHCNVENKIDPEKIL